jgi:hypothetical protein
MYLWVFEGAELESAVHLPRNLIDWPKTNGNRDFGKMNIIE